MTLSEISIRRPVFAWMLMIALMLFGALAFTRMGVSLLPDIDFPQVNVSVTYEGAAPELIETDITDILEGALVGVEGVKNISSSSRFGSANINLEFELGRNIDAAIQDVQSALQGVARALPDEMEAPIVSKSNPEDRPIMVVSVLANVPVRELNFYVRNTLRDRFTSIEGVSEVSLGGAITPQIRVWLDPRKLNQYELTAQDVVATLQSEHTEIPAGRIIQEKNELNLRILGEAKTPEELGNIIISRRSGTPLFNSIRIRDLGRVEAGTEEIRRLARADGKIAIGMSIKKQRGVNAVAVADRVQKRIAELDLPAGYEVGTNFDNTKFIRESVAELNWTMLLSILLTALMCWAFLGSLSATYNVLLSIPTSILGTFIIIHLLGFTLNSFTMLALILVIGIVVDDTIMVLENIARMREEGLSPMEAARRGANQIAPAAFATTLSIIAIFLPVVFVEGLTGAYLFQFGVTLSVAVALSLLEALTLTPMRLSRMKQRAHGEEKLGFLPGKVDQAVRALSRAYGAWIERTVSSRPRSILVYIVALGIFLSSFIFIKILPKEFSPEDDVGVLFARAEVPLGVNFTEASRRFETVEKIIGQEESVKRVYSIIGGFGSQVNTATLFVTLKERKDRQESQRQVQDKLRDSLKPLAKEGTVVRIQSGGGGGFGGRRGYPVDLDIKGNNWEQLVSSIEKLQKEFEKEPALTDVDTSYEEGTPELQIIPNRTAAIAKGVSVQALSETLSFAYNGVKAGKFNDSGKRTDIIVQADRSLSPTQPKDIGKLYIRNNRGFLIPLTDVVELKENKSLVSITRENRERNISIYANVATGYAQDAAIARAVEIAKRVLPPEVRAEKTGSSAEMQKTFLSLVVALGVGIIVAYMILASQYNSYVHPITILLALPFSVTGAWITLWLGGSSINVYSMIGLILLMGLVKKNSILLVEFTNQLRHDAGTPVVKALAQAGETRLRPILMTSVCTMAAAIPPALKLGHGTAATTPMALCILGGTFFSTALTLFVVPVAYHHFTKLERWWDPAENFQNTPVARS